MGGGTSKSCPKIQIDDYEVLLVAEDANVDLLTKKGLKTSFPQGIGVDFTADVLKVAEDSWCRICENKMERFRIEMQSKYSEKQENNDLGFFVQKFYARISDTDRNAYDLYPSENAKQVRIVVSMVRAVLTIGSNMLVASGVPCNLQDSDNLKISFPSTGFSTSTNAKSGVPAADLITSCVAYRTAKSHYLMGVQSKEYRLMGSAFVDTIKYVFGKENPSEVKELVKVWCCIFSNVLLDVMKYGRAMEMIYSPESLSSSGSSSSLNVASSVVEGVKSYHGSSFFDENGAPAPSPSERGAPPLLGSAAEYMVKVTEEIPSLDEI